MGSRNYRPGIDPAPRMWFRGYVSAAQARKFMRTARLARYRAGMRWHTPPVGPGSIHTKITARGVPARLHPKKSKSKKRR